MKMKNLVLLIVLMLPFASARAEGPYCAGKTTPGSTDWKQYGSKAVYLDVDTSECVFSETPLYFTSLGGSSWHWRTTGATSIYRASPNGFRVYISSNAEINPSLVNSKQWHINWVAYPKNVRLTDFCTGTTEPGATEWQNYGSRGIYVDIDVSGCDFYPIQNLFEYIIQTSVVGNSNHWQVTGVTSLYQDNLTQSFRIYLYGKSASLTPDYANDRNWHINWAIDSGMIQDNNVGFTSPDDWESYNDRGIYVDVESPIQSSNPLFFTSLSGNSRHWRTTGATSIYPTSTGFRVYVYDENGSIDPEIARTRGWKVSYKAISGETSHKPMAWLKLGGSSWYRTSDAFDSCTEESKEIVDQFGPGSYCKSLVHGYKCLLQDVDEIQSRFWDPNFPSHENSIGNTWSCSHWDHQQWVWRDWYYATPPKVNAVDWAGQNKIFYKVREWEDFNNWNFYRSYFDIDKDGYDVSECMEDWDGDVSKFYECHDLPNPVCYPVTRYGFVFDCPSPTGCLAIYETWACMVDGCDPATPDIPKCAGCDEAALQFMQ